VVTRLNRELNNVVRDPDVVATLARSGAEVTTGTPAQFAQVIRAEHEAWKAVIQRAGIKSE
jgi:tripartite-type tricarboxylate transporter receptor subunit TctC